MYAYKICDTFVLVKWTSFYICFQCQQFTKMHFDSKLQGFQIYTFTLQELKERKMWTSILYLLYVLLGTWIDHIVSLLNYPFIISLWMHHSKTDSHSFTSHQTVCFSLYNVCFALFISMAWVFLRIINLEFKLNKN